MNVNTLESILDSFANSGEIFSNELEFQFELSKKLESLPFVQDVIFEAMTTKNAIGSIMSSIKSTGKYAARNKEYTDILVQTIDDRYYAIELKFKTDLKPYVYKSPRRGNVLVMAQGAYDINAYAFWKDVSRLENINKRYFGRSIKIEKGFVIFLTNCKQYRKNNFSGSTIWKNYAMNDGRIVKGPSTFTFASGALTYGKYNAIKINNSYEPLMWHDYIVNQSPLPDFSYLILTVTP